MELLLTARVVISETRGPGTERLGWNLYPLP